MRELVIKWRVYPTEPVFGFTQTYCKSETSAEWQKLKMEIASGIEWKIERIERWSK